jgi:D-sedoheptulose 7-phosphate isomerase
MAEELQKVLEKSAKEITEAMAFLRTPEPLSFMQKLSNLLAKTFSNGNKVLIAGNGGSLCDAAHFAEELTGCFRKKRRALPAIVLSEPGAMSCVANDFGFEEIFSRGVEAFGAHGDLFIALTTSGCSPNVMKAVEEARRKKLGVVCLLGKGGGDLLDQADLQLVVPHSTTSDRIQEVHMACLHMVIEGMEHLLFAKK